MWFADTFHYKTFQFFNFTTERVCVCMVVMERKYMAVVKTEEEVNCCGGEGVHCYVVGWGAR